MPSDRDRKFLEALRARLPEAAGSLQRIVVTLDDRPSEAVALYVNDDWDLIGVGEVAVSSEREGCPLSRPRAAVVLPYRHRDLPGLTAPEDRRRARRPCIARWDNRYLNAKRKGANSCSWQ